MVLVSGTTVVDRKVQDVWKFINDLSALPTWAQNVKRAVWTHKKRGKGQGVGATFNQTQREGLSDIIYAGEVLEWEEFKRRKTVVRHEAYEIFATFELEPTEVPNPVEGQPPLSHTIITLTIEVPSHTWLQWIFSPLSWAISKITMPNQLNVLRGAASAYKLEEVPVIHQ